jgi:hypothetical protein
MPIWHLRGWVCFSLAYIWVGFAVALPRVLPLYEKTYSV